MLSHRHRREQPVKAQKEWRELTLPGGPGHERQVHLSVDEPQPLRVLTVFLDADLPAMEHGVVDLLANLSLENLVDREERLRIFAAKAIKQALAKDARHDRRLRRELLKGCGPAVTDEHGAMSGDEEELLFAITDAAELLRRDGLSVEDHVGRKLSMFLALVGV